MSKKKEQEKRSRNLFLPYLILIFAVLSFFGISFIVKINHGEEIETTYTFELSENQIPAEMTTDMGEVIVDDTIPTVEEVDGGRFEDKDTGLSLVDNQYEDLGAMIELFDTSTPETFKNDTLGKCIYANNKYGAQCVSLARSFWFSYAGRDVTTCGTGMAKGMMNCAEENAGDDFVIYWSDAKYFIQAGDWLVFDGGQYGHVGMALGGYNNGYVALLGENQGGIPCDGGGSATNIINISLKKLIGFYRPKAYIIPEPEPETPDTGIVNQ